MVTSFLRLIVPAGVLIVLLTLQGCVAYSGYGYGDGGYYAPAPTVVVPIYQGHSGYHGGYGGGYGGGYRSGYGGHRH
jgi:hypothetical protein